MKKKIYLSLEILNWDVFVGSWTSIDIEDIKRPYEIISYSESLIKDKASDFNLSDSIGNLKRALNHRLKLIEYHYELKSIKFNGAPKGYLELLAEYGLARPYIIKKLMEIRNNIEHKDAKPPRKERCLELIDVTWYFLKSTDRLLYTIPSYIELNPNSIGLAEKYGCSFDFNSTNTKIKISGWVPTSYINTEKNNALEISCSVIHEGSFWKDKDPKNHKDKTNHDTWIIGQFIINDDEKKAILKKCFESY